MAAHLAQKDPLSELCWDPLPALILLVLFVPTYFLGILLSHFCYPENCSASQPPKVSLVPILFLSTLLHLPKVHTCTT